MYLRKVVLFRLKKRLLAKRKQEEIEKKSSTAYSSRARGAQEIPSKDLQKSLHSCFKKDDFNMLSPFIDDEGII